MIRRIIFCIFLFLSWFLFAHPVHAADPVWGPKVRVNDDVGWADQWYPAIAVTVDSVGNAYAVWMDKRDGNHYDIYVDYRPAGGTWGSEIKVNDFSTIGFDPNIAVDGSGNAYVLWASGRHLYYVYLPSGGGWKTENIVREQVTDSDAQAIAWADIAVDTEGNAYAIWIDRRNPQGIYYDQDLYGDSRPKGGGWGTDQTINDVPKSVNTGGKNTPSLAIDSSGTLYAVWSDIRSGVQQIYFSYRPQGGSWSGNEPVNGFGSFNPSIAADPSGNVYVIWMDESTHSDIYFRFRDQNGNWGEMTKVNDDEGFAYQAAPAIAVDSSGNAYAVWTDNRNTIPGDSCQIYSSYRKAKGTWSPNVPITPEISHRKQDPDVAVDGLGYAYAVWMEETENSWDIYFSTTAPSSPELVAVDVAVPQALTLNEDGWYAQNPTEIHVNVSNRGSDVVIGNIEVSFSNPNRLLFDDKGTLIKPPAILKRLINIQPGQSLSEDWLMWIQPMSQQNILFTGKVFYQSGQLAGKGTTSMVVPTARIHPVVVIPGLMGSMKNAFGQWTIDPIAGTYNNLLEELQLAGYEKDKSLFTFPYDWRQHVSESGNELGVEIRNDMLPKASGYDYIDSSSVDLLGHSLGGLVSRAYVQSVSYTGDVHRLITLGTPHLGAPKAYLGAEGLEFDFFDDVVGNKGKILAEWLLRALARKNGYCTDLIKLCFTTKADLYHYIKDKVPSVREIFPVDDYLKDDPGGYLVSADESSTIYPFDHQVNEFLTSLNADIDDLIDRLGVSNVISVVGNRYENERPLEDTDKLYKVVGRNLLDNIYDMWRNGRVLSGRVFRPQGRGDETVPTGSADLSLIDVRLRSQEKTQGDDKSVIEHGHMPTQLQQSIVELLTKIRPFFNASFIDPGINWPEAALGFINLSPVEIQITDPLGRRVGLDFNTGEELSEIPGTSFSRSIEVNEPDFILIPDSLEGKYTIKLQGIDEGNYTVLIQALSEEGFLTFAEFTGPTSLGDIHEHTAVYNRASLPTAPLSIQWHPPLNNPDKPRKVTRNATLPIKFTIRDVEGKFVKDESVQVWVVDPSDPSSAIATLSMEDPSLHGKSDVIRIDTNKQHYIVNLHLRDYNFESGKIYLIGVSEFGNELGANAIFVVGD